MNYPSRKIGDNWGHTIVVVNRAGATGGIALELTANAPPDGHALVIASTRQIINQHLSKVRCDFLRDFAPISGSGSLPYAISLLESFPVSLEHGYGNGLAVGSCCAPSGFEARQRNCPMSCPDLIV